MKTPDNPPAFPSPDTVYPNGQCQPGCYGMTLRDYFAGQAVAEQFKFTVSDSEILQGAARCFKIADAMLAERSREKGTPNEPKP